MNISGIIRLKRGKEISVQRRHPWIFSGAIQLVEGAPPEGSWVAVTDHRNQPLGFGHYQTGSITVRMLTFGAEAPTDVFWETKIKSALQLRATAGLP
jgi:23S rRNA (cytosine1962-C5)-methyltransferase